MKKKKIITIFVGYNTVRSVIIVMTARRANVVISLTGARTKNKKKSNVRLNNNNNNFIRFLNFFALFRPVDELFFVNVREREKKQKTNIKKKTKLPIHIAPSRGVNILLQRY